MLNTETSAAKPSFWRRLLSWELLAFAALFVGLQFWQARDMPGGGMPAIAGQLTDGRPVSLADTLRLAQGKPVLVYVWATWCPVCRASESGIASIARERPVLTVAIQSGDAAEVAKYMDKEGVSFPALVDGQGEIARQLGVRGVPAFFVVDAPGRIRFSGVGLVTEWGLRLRLWWAGVA